jgi:hypothetical protein
MGDTWIIDMSHFDYKNEEAQSLPKAARRLAEYFASIIEGTVHRASIGEPYSGVRCRRRPRRRACGGVIRSELSLEGAELHWWCPVCGDNGRISNWAGTRWDPAKRRKESLRHQSGKLFEKGPVPGDLDTDNGMRIRGRIEWDEESEGELPRIATGRRVYSWLELGKELMTYEGFDISIRIM